MNDKVCATIVTYNTGNKIIEVIDAIVSQVDKVVIIDNNSDDYTLNILDNISNNCKVNIIYNKENLGIAKALNQGIEYAKINNFKWVFTLDHDSICEEFIIEKMLEAYNLSSEKEIIGIVVPRIFDINKQDYIDKYRKSSKNSEVFVKDAIQSGSLIKLQIFNKVGMFNEKLFIYHVDYDFCERVIRSGYKILKNENATLFHEEGNKLRKNFFGFSFFYNNYNKIAIYYITRNTIFMCKNYSVKYSKRIIKDIISILLFDEEKYEKLKYLFCGINDARKLNYGKLE